MSSLDDLPPLVESILQRLNSNLRFFFDALACLKQHAFPGNIRELRNVVERAALMCDGNTILRSHLPAKFCVAADEQVVIDGEQNIRTFEDIEIEHLKGALRRHQGDRRSLAEKLGTVNVRYTEK